MYINLRNIKYSRMAYLNILLAVCTCLLQCAGILADVCGKTSCFGDLECCPSGKDACCTKENEDDSSLRIIVMCALVGTLVIALVVGLICYCIISKKKQQNLSITPGQQVTIVGRVQFAQPGSSTYGPASYGPTDNYPMEAPPKYESFNEGPHPVPQGPMNEEGDMHKTPL